MAQKIILFLVIFGFLVAAFKLKRLVMSLSIFKYKIVYGFLIPVALFVLWVSLSVREIYRQDNVLLQLTSQYSQANLKSPDYSELVQGKKITGQFTARENFLGIVAVRFWNFFRLNSDYVTFRIREAKQFDWFYQNSHKVDQFQPHGLFPFGFPVIPGSAGKTYVFEIESTAGSPGNAIGLSPIEPVFVTRFKYPRSLVTTSVPDALYFFFRKLVNLFMIPKFVASSFIHLLPLLIYILYLHWRTGRQAGRTFVSAFVNVLESRTQRFDQEISRQTTPLMRQFYRFLFWSSTGLAKFIKDDKSSPRISQSLFYLAITFDVFWIRRDDTAVIMLLILWIFLVKIYKVSLKTTYVTALFLFTLSLITWYHGDINVQFISERALAWSFLFVTLAAIQMTFKLPSK